MVKLYGKEYSKEALLRHIGDVRQAGGVRKYELAEGKEKGVSVAEFRTGAGLNFNVLLDHGMDISMCEYNGQSLCWRSGIGDASPAFFEVEGLQWMRNFPGGMVSTCGLRTIGKGSVDNGEVLTQHGRIGNIPASNVCVDGAWEGDEYVMWAQGKVREHMVFFENVQLERKVWARLGEKRFFIRDEVSNLGHATTEHMILYHINTGFPVLDANSVMLSPSVSAKPWDAEADKGKAFYDKSDAPTKNFREHVFYIDMNADDDGFVKTAMVNREIGGGEGLGVYVKYKKDQLPNFIEWKMIGEGLYVFGMEPGNGTVDGRDKARERGTLDFLEPGEKRLYELEIGVLKGKEEIGAFEREVNCLK